MIELHTITLTTTDGSTPESTAATTTVALDGKTIEGVRKCKINWLDGGVPEVILHFGPGAVEINVSAETKINLGQAQFTGEEIEAVER
jgi:hypothetical protein